MENKLLRVLVVEDDDDEAQLIRTLLTSANSAVLDDLTFEIDRVGGMSDAVELVKSKKIDIILLDLNLPDSSGLDSLFKMRLEAPFIPIVVLTGAYDRKLAIDILYNGAQDYLIKGKADHQLLARSLRYAVERKRVEDHLKIAQAQLIQAEKMKSVGRLAAGAAHEVKNPLAILMMGIDFLSRKQQPEDEKTISMLERMREAIRRADYVIKGLLDFASLKELSMQKHNIHDVIDECLDLEKHDYEKKQIQIHKQFDVEPLQVMMDRNRMQQVFINLFSNAIHSCANNGELTIKTHEEKSEHLALYVGRRRDDLFKPGDRVVVIEILDNGSGISPEAVEHIFEPFFTTKRNVGGTGLGLPVVKSIIEQHQGIIEIINRPDGAGACVRILLKGCGYE